MRISHSSLLLTCSTLALCLPFASWAETGPPASSATRSAAEDAKTRQHQTSTSAARTIGSGTGSSTKGDTGQKTDSTHPAPRPADKPRHERIHVYGDGHATYAAEESSIGDKTGVSFLQQTQTANVVTHQTLKDMAPQTMEDMTKYVPGMTVGNNFAGTQDNLLKRGFGSNLDGSVLRDGIRMPNGRNFTSATTERVEILKGPASLFYGMQEPGGVINIITKQPRKKWTAALDSTWASLGGGSGTLDLGGPILPSKEFTFRLIANYKNENYWRNFGANKQKVVAPSFRYEHQRLKVDLSYQWEDYDNVFDRGAFINQATGKPISGPKYRLDEHGTSAYGTRHLLAGAIEYRLSKQDRLRLTSGWNQDDYHDKQVEPSSYNAATGILTRRFRSNTSELRTNSYVALDYLAEHRFLSMTHKLALGGDYENRRVTQGAFLASKNIPGFRPADPIYGQLPLTGPEALNNGNQHSRINNASFYFKDNIQLGHGITISPGVRYQWFHYSYGAQKPFIKSVDSSYSKPLPFIGVVYQPAKHFSLYWDYSQSYNPEQISPGTTLSGQYKPSSGRQFEVGARYQQGFLTADVALYDIRKKNILQTTGTDSSGRTLQRQTGLAGSKGIEAEVNGRINQHWNILTNYAYTYARTIKDTSSTEGKRLYNVPRHSGGGYLTYQTQLPWHHSNLRFGAGAHYVGRRAGNVTNSFWMPGYATVDLFASWRMREFYGHSTTLQVNAENIANKAYLISSAGSLNRVSWGQGRTIRVNVGMAL